MWSHIPEHLNPVFVKIGPFQAHYYGLMYIAAFLTVYLLILYRLKNDDTGISRRFIDDCFFWVILSVLVGGRLGYALFYNPGYYISHPLEIILPFDTENGFKYTGLYGMSYHGALLAVIFTAAAYCRSQKTDFWKVADLFASAVPLGYTFGRLGNFINGELYGRVTKVPWAMYFPLDPSRQLRHPSQLYEALFEGVLLFLIIWPLRKKMPATGCLFGLYLAGYGVIRFFLEFFREPDAQLGFVLGPFTMGQLLCFAMVLSGAGIFAIRVKIRS